MFLSLSFFFLLSISWVCARALVFFFFSSGDSTNKYRSLDLFVLRVIISKERRYERCQLPISVEWCQMVLLLSTSKYNRKRILVNDFNEQVYRLRLLHEKVFQSHLSRSY